MSDGDEDRDVVFAAEPEPGDPQVGDRAIVVHSWREGRIHLQINDEWATTEGHIELDAAGVKRLIGILQRFAP